MIKENNHEKSALLLCFSAALLMACSSAETISSSIQSSSQSEQSSIESKSSESHSSSSSKESSSSIEHSSSEVSSSEYSSSESSYSSSSSESSSQAIQTYLITFKDENDSVLDSRQWEVGSTPSYNYTKTDTDEWDYTVQGWSTSFGGSKITIPQVTCSATYWAVVAKVKKQYTITFNSNSGSSVNPITADYGTSVPKPADPTRDGYKFVGWASDSQLKNTVTWPYVLTKNVTFYAAWNEKVDIKGYLKSALESLNCNPYSFIPTAMQPFYANNLVEQSNVTYDFNNFVNVSNIRYGGFGEQWNMVIENIQESERFFSILTVGETAISAATSAFNNYLDKNTNDTADHSLKETTYTASIKYANNVLDYSLRYETNLSIPFFGTVNPQIDISYNIKTLERNVRIQLTENNVLKYTSSPNKYEFAIQYGVSAVSRKAYCIFEKQKDESVKGHIYEYVQLKGKDMVPSCADFYIDNTYVSVVGNKASGMTGFTGYINELYKANEGKLLGYEVREELTKFGFTATYHTLWFNLNSISGITSVKAIANDNLGVYGDNNHDIYVNGGTSIFTPTYNYKSIVKTSRKYDIELRKQYFFGYDSAEKTYVRYEVSIPMMFIQADHDSYTNFSDFPTDMNKTSKISGASVTLSSTYLTKIQSDYASLIDLFVTNKNNFNSEFIVTYLGEAKELK